MFNAVSTALSGLTAASTAINVIGNDLANLNTTGYKATDVSFYDLVSQSLGAAPGSGQTGHGIGDVRSLANYTQGSLQTTKGALDCAIQGNGFFVIKNDKGGTLYTRDGGFHLDTNGKLVNASGASVQGWTATNGVIDASSTIGDISLPVWAAVPASATTKMSLGVNLDSRVATTDPNATFSAPIQVVDTQGTSHTLSVTFNKTGSNAWNYGVTIPANDLTAGGTTNLISGTLTFDSSGNLTSPAVGADPHTINITNLANGSADMQIDWNLYDSLGSPTITQFAASSGTSAIVQNGYEAGQISNVALQAGGNLVANYSNGRHVILGQLAVASISNPATLVGVGGNMLQVSAYTAPPAIGTANSGARGQVEAGVLESSTVDIAKEFTNLLTFQRTYQANSRVITTSDQILQETVNLIHG